MNYLLLPIASASAISIASARDTSHLAKLSLPNIYAIALLKYVPSVDSQLSCFIMVLLLIFCVLDNSPPLAEQCCAVCKDCDKEYTEMTVNEIINGKVSECGIYHLPTKLREGNVFSRVCLSVILFKEGGCV